MFLVRTVLLIMLNNMTWSNGNLGVKYNEKLHANEFANVISLNMCYRCIFSSYCRTSGILFGNIFMFLHPKYNVIDMDMIEGGSRCCFSTIIVNQNCVVMYGVSIGKNHKCKYHIEADVQRNIFGYQIF